MSEKRLAGVPHMQCTIGRIGLATLGVLLAAALATPRAAAHPGAGIVAASGCSAVLKVSPTGAVDVVVRSSDAWAPTGLAVSGDDLYVLEFRHIAVERAQDWLPRVRKVAHDGTVTLVTTVDAPSR